MEVLYIYHTATGIQETKHRELAMAKSESPIIVQYLHEDGVMSVAII